MGSIPADVIALGVMVREPAASTGARPRITGVNDGISSRRSQPGSSLCPASAPSVPGRVELRTMTRPSSQVTTSVMVVVQVFRLLSVTVIYLPRSCAGSARSATVARTGGGGRRTPSLAARRDSRRPRTIPGWQPHRLGGASASACPDPAVRVGCTLRGRGPGLSGSAIAHLRVYNS